MSREAIMQRIVPNIWCQGNAEEAGQFYASAFDDATSWVDSRYPETGLLDFQQNLAGKPLTVAVEIHGSRLTLINAGEEFTPNPSISFFANFDPLLFDGSEAQARAVLDAAHRALIDAGGTELMPLGEYPFSAHYAWVQDHYGVSWQLMLRNPAGDPRPFIVPSLMFSGPVQNHAGEAIGLYLDVFRDAFGAAELGGHAEYPEQTGPAAPGALMFADIQIAGEWIAAMDSGVEQDTTFDAGVSLEVRCDDQQQLDRVWNALSAAPEAEVCGWLQDRFGVSWQIVPANIDELMQRPGAFEKLLGMKKLVIADF